ncbi:MAG: RidA family protein [Bacteroidota bacterium]
MSRTIIFSPHAPEPIGPYSQAVQAGSMLFISGQIALDQGNGKFVNANIKDETKQVMKNIEHILSAAGLNFTHVVKSTIFLKNMGDFPQVNEVYGAYFPDQPPARETVEVSKLPKEANVEISCIAVK